MNEKQRSHQSPQSKPLNDGETNEGELSVQAQDTLGTVEELDTKIDDILSSTINGDYLKSTTQKGGE